MGKPSLKVIDDGITKKLYLMAQRVNDIRGYLNRVVYPQIQNAQMKRWMTEGSSEGEKWKPLSEPYKTYKKSRYGGGPRFRAGKPGAGEGRWVITGSWMRYPGRGTKTLIATGNLVSAVIGPTKEGTVFGVKTSALNHRKLVEKTSIKLFYTVKYGPDVNRLRRFHGLSEHTVRYILSGIRTYLIKGAFPTERK